MRGEAFMSEYRWKTTKADQALPKRLPPLLTEWQAGSLWTAVTAFGLVLGMSFNAITSQLLLGAVVAGIIIGWTQMLVLKLQRARGDWSWIFNTTMAFGTWGAAIPYLGGFTVWSGLGLGVLVGVLQYLALRYRVEQAAHWIWINLVAWAIGLGLYKVILSISGTWLIGFTVTGLIGGAITGTALAWLLRKPVIVAPSEAPMKDDYQS